MELHPDAFSSGQILSKLWLAEALEQVIDKYNFCQPRKILCLGGWYGIMNFVLQARNKIQIESYRSLDIDPEVERLADLVNNSWEWQDWKFKAITGDANNFKYSQDQFNTVINTSTEHLESKDWFDLIPSGCLVALQSNNMLHEEHCHNHTSLADLRKEYLLSEIYFAGEKIFEYPTWQFTRFMIIGKK